MVNGVEAPAPGDWNIDPAHSELAFIARYLMVTKVRGGFTDFSGTLHIAEKPEESWVEITIKAASIDTGTPDRDKHLRSADFLDVERFPELRFKSTKVELTGGMNLTVTGDLTIRDVTKPVVLDAEFQGIARDPWGGTRAAFRGRPSPPPPRSIAKSSERAGTWPWRPAAGWCRRRSVSNWRPKRSGPPTKRPHREREPARGSPSLNRCAPSALLAEVLTARSDRQRVP